VQKGKTMKNSVARAETFPADTGGVPYQEPPLADGRRARTLVHALCARYMHESREILKRHDMTPLQYVVMLEAWASAGIEELTVTELARRLEVRHNSAVVLADTLCSKGYLSRSRSAEDRRRVLLKTTEQGDHMVEKLIHAHRGQLDDLRSQLTD
jgi:DNA-binding MarR family transcriptional regulator